MRKRASAIIVRDKKLLLVGDSEQKHYWTPGGGVEEGETNEQTLEREIAEELGCKALDKEFLTSYETGPQLIAGKEFEPYEVHSYLVEIAGAVKPSAEIEKVFWATKEDIESLEIPKMLREVVIPKLVKDGLL